MIWSSLVHHSVLLLYGALDQLKKKKNGMSRRQLQDLARNRAARLQIPCHTVYRRKVNQIAPLGI